jgi:hypothetical protein
MTLSIEHTLVALSGAIALTACSSAATPAQPTDGGVDAAESGVGEADAEPDAPDAPAAEASVDKTMECAKTFGSAIGAVGFARFDGTVVAVLPPDNRTCTAPNSTHLVLELTFSGAVYRMVVDVNDSASAGTIRANTVSRPLIGGSWSDGWHGVSLDYAGDLALHAADFTSESTAGAVTAITAALVIGAHVSVFATAMGEVDSAHLVHRNLPKQDGAIVVGVDGSPTWLLFAFSDQSF